MAPLVGHGTAAATSAPAVDAAGGEMAPAGVEGNVEGRIGGSSDRRRHFVGRRIEPGEIDREMVQASLDTVFEQTVVRARARRRR